MSFEVPYLDLKYYVMQEVRNIWKFIPSKQ